MPSSPAAELHQRRQYSLMRTMLHPCQLLVLMDFTSAKLDTKPGADAIVQDCIVVLEYLDEAGSKVRRNLNFLCDDYATNDADFYFVLTLRGREVPIGTGARFSCSISSITHRLQTTRICVKRAHRELCMIL